MKNIKRISSISVVIVLMSMHLAGCHHKEDGYDKAMANQLFQKSVKLIELYTDSVKIATDSAMLQRLSVEFDDRLAKINFQFPADTDLLLSEGDNDSIINMMERLVAEFQKRGKELDAQFRADSLKTDSLSAVRLPGLPSARKVTIPDSAKYGVTRAR